MRAHRLVPWLLLSALTACHPCDSVSDMRVDGDSPYVRCAELPPPEPGERTVGALTLTIEGRALTISGGVHRLALFRGPAPRREHLAEALATLDDEGAQVYVVLGGLGDDMPAALETLQALSATERPVLVLAGGRDEAGALTEAFDGLNGAQSARVVDARGLRSVRLGGVSLALLSGAPRGRYARTDDACGYGSEDLEALKAALPPEGARYLVSWAAPASELSLGFDQVQAGDPELANWLREAELKGALSAWPAIDAGRHVQGEGAALSAICGALGAPRVRLVDGGYGGDSALVLDLTPTGLALTGRAVEPAPADH